MRPLRRGDSPYGLALREGYAVYIHRQAVMCPLHRQVKAAALIEGIGRQISRTPGAHDRRTCVVPHSADQVTSEAFAAQPDCQGAQFEAARQELHDHFKATQQRIMRVMEECCYKRDIPEVALVAVPRCWPRTRPGLSHRLYSRWDAAKAGFTAAVEALRTAGQVPVEMMADRHGQGVLLTLD